MSQPTRSFSRDTNATSTALSGSSGSAMRRSGNQVICEGACATTPMRDGVRRENDREPGRDDDVKLTIAELKTAMKVTRVSVRVTHEGENGSVIKVLPAGVGG